LPLIVTPLAAAFFAMPCDIADFSPLSPLLRHALSAIILMKRHFHCHRRLMQPFQRRRHG